MLLYMPVNTVSRRAFLPPPGSRRWPVSRSGLMCSKTRLIMPSVSVSAGLSVPMAPLRTLFQASLHVPAATFASLESMLRRSNDWSPGCEEKSAVPMGIFFLESAHCTARILSSTAPSFHANIISSWTHIDCSIPSLIALHAGGQQEPTICPPRRRHNLATGSRFGARAIDVRPVLSAGT